MNDASPLLRRLLLWAVPFAIVVAALAYETDWGRAITHDTPPPAASSPQPVAIALLPEYRIDGGTEARRQTVERVLFNPTRRPAPATQGPGGKSALQRGLYTLTGTTVVGNVATAFLREVNGGKSHSVRQGDKLNDVLVAEVKPDHVRLKQGDDVEDLQLKIAAGPKTTVQVAVAPLPGAPGQPNAQAAAAAAAAAAARAAAGGSAAAVNDRRIARPVAPIAGTPPRTGSVSVGELLAERRRAARAAAAAAAGQAPAPGVLPK